MAASARKPNHTLFFSVAPYPPGLPSAPCPLRICSLGTVTETEAAIKKLPPLKQRELADRLNSRLL